MKVLHLKEQKIYYPRKPPSIVTEFFPYALKQSGFEANEFCKLLSTYYENFWRLDKDSFVKPLLTDQKNIF